MNTIKITKISLKDLDKSLNKLQTVLKTDSNIKREKYIEDIPMVVPVDTVIKDSIDFGDELKKDFDVPAVKYHKDIPLGTIENLIQEGTIKLNLPGQKNNVYQRNVVHDNKWASNLLFDIIVGVQNIQDIILAPSFNEDVLSIHPIDGQQRLIAVHRILNNEIKFTGTNSCLDGHYFREIPVRDQKTIKMKTLSTQFCRESLSEFKVWAFAKLNATAAKVNSTEYLTALYPSEALSQLESLLKENPYAANCLYGIPVSASEEERLVSTSTEKDRKKQLDMAMFAIANCMFDLKELPATKRKKKTIIEYFLSKLQKEKLSANLSREIKAAFKTLYVVFGPSRLGIYRRERVQNGLLAFCKDADGNYIHATTPTVVQLKSLFFASWMLNKEKVKLSEISDSLKAKVRAKTDEYLTSAEYAAVKGNNNDITTHRMNQNFTKEIGDILGLDIEFND